MTKDNGYNHVGWLIWLEVGWQQWCQACIEDGVPNTLARQDWYEIVAEMGSSDRVVAIVSNFAEMGSSDRVE